YLWHFPIIVLTTLAVQRSVNLPLQILQVVATIVVAALSWRFLEEPIRRGALGRIWARTRSRVWRRKAIPRQAVPRRIYRRQRRQRIAIGIVSITALRGLALDGAGLAGGLGRGRG